KRGTSNKVKFSASANKNPPTGEQIGNNIPNFDSVVADVQGSSSLDLACLTTCVRPSAISSVSSREASGVNTSVPSVMGLVNSGAASQRDVFVSLPKEQNTT